MLLCIFSLVKLFYLDRVTPQGLVFEPFANKSRPRVKFWSDEDVKLKVYSLTSYYGIYGLDKVQIKCIYT